MGGHRADASTTTVDPVRPAGEWLDTLIEADAKRVRSGGERALARRLLYELHMVLFG
jgi:hypothetical protein